jgi:hypothetical protein
MQFHPESVLSIDGLEILTETLQALLATRPVTVSANREEEPCPS